MSEGLALFLLVRIALTVRAEWRRCHALRLAPWWWVVPSVN